MANVTFNELGIPVVLIDPPMITVRGQLVPDVNLRQLADAVFGLLIVKPARLTGDEVRFIRKHLRLRQADLARVLNMGSPCARRLLAAEILATRELAPPELELLRKHRGFETSRAVNELLDRALAR